MVIAPLAAFILLAQTPAQAPATGSALITGRVVDATTSRGVSAATVSIQSSTGGPSQAERLLTDTSGRYFFDNLTKGSYTLTVKKPGWIDGAFGKVRADGSSQLLTLTSDDERRTADIALWKFSVVSGFVTDEAGDPVVDLQVRAVRRRILAGRPQLEFAGVARTDDRGAFRLVNLVPGDYSVFIPSETSAGTTTTSGGGQPADWLLTMTSLGTAPLMFRRESAIAAADGRNLLSSTSPLLTAPGAGAWLTVPPTFLSGASTPGSAFVRVGSGQERSGLALAVRRVATHQVSGTLVVPGTSAANHVLHLLPAELTDFPLFEIATAVADAAGAFSFFGVPPGNYLIRVVKSPLPSGDRRPVLVSSTRDEMMVMTVTTSGAPPDTNEGQLWFANEPVSVGAQSIQNINVTLRPGARVTGRAEFDGTAMRPQGDAWTRVSVPLEFSNGYAPRHAPIGRFAADGTFKSPSLLPGSYVIRPQAPPGWTVKNVNAGGRDVTERAIDIGGDIGDVVITFTDHPGKVSGVVDAGAAEIPPASVLLFPSNRDGWTDYGVNSRRLSAARVGAGGVFSFAAVPAGSYFAVAVLDEDAVDWQDPAALAKLVTLATEVGVRDGESPNVNLSLKAIR